MFRSGNENSSYWIIAVETRFYYSPQSGDTTFNREMIFDTLSGALTYFCRKHRVLSHPEHVPRHSVDVSLIDEETGFALDHNIGNAGMTRRHNWQSGGSCFQNRHRSAFPITRGRFHGVLHKASASSQFLPHDLWRLPLKKRHGVRQRKLLRQHFALV